MSEQAPATPEVPVYKRRKPESTVLYQVLQEHLETFVARLEAGEGGARASERADAAPSCSSSGSGDPSI
jgi:hypothetical protein